MLVLLWSDIIHQSYLSERSNHLVYFIDHYENIDEIINHLNIDIFGENITEMPDPEIDVVVKFVDGFNPNN